MTLDTESEIALSETLREWQDQIKKEDSELDIEESFCAVEKMLYALAWRTAKATGIPFEECKSEAYWGFVQAARKYKAGADASFVTWCHLITSFKLKTLQLNRYKVPIFLEINEETCGEAPEQRSPSLELIDDLSADAREMISLLLETPREILEDRPCTPRKLLKKVKDYLIARGKRRVELDRADAEIRQRFSEAWA